MTLIVKVLLNFKNLSWLSKLTFGSLKKGVFGYHEKKWFIRVALKACLIKDGISLLSNYKSSMILTTIL